MLLLNIVKVVYTFAHSPSVGMGMQLYLSFGSGAPYLIFLLE